MPRETPYHVFELPRVHRHAELSRGRERHEVAGVLLGRARILSTSRNAPVCGLVRIVQAAHEGTELPLDPGIPDFRGHDNVARETDVSLGFLRIRGEPETFELLDGEPRETGEIEIDDGVLGHRGVPETEDDALVRSPRLFNGPARLFTKGRDALRIPADAGVRSRNDLGRHRLAETLPHLGEKTSFRVESRERYLHPGRRLSHVRS